MSWFDNNEDPFEDIVREFFGGRPSKAGSKSFSRESQYPKKDFSNFIFSSKKDYLVLDLSGKKVVSVSLEKNPSREQLANDSEIGKQIIEIKLNSGELKQTLPKQIKSNKIDWKVTNGILEVEFKK